jgi:hypothetical protein
MAPGVVCPSTSMAGSSSDSIDAPDVRIRSWSANRFAAHGSGRHPARAPDIRPKYAKSKYAESSLQPLILMRAMSIPTTMAAALVGRSVAVRDVCSTPDVAEEVENVCCCRPRTARRAGPRVRCLPRLIVPGRRRRPFQTIRLRATVPAATCIAASSVKAVMSPGFSRSPAWRQPSSPRNGYATGTWNSRTRRRTSSSGISRP